MVVRKTHGGYAVVHCHGSNKGKVAGKVYRGAGARAKAQRQHRAIQANKRRH